jgi:hypothetical protein
MAIGAGVFVVLAIAAVAVTAPGGDGIATPRLVMTRSVGPNGEYTHVAVPGPVGRDQRVALTADDGARVVVGITQTGDAASFEGSRFLTYTVHFHNTGNAPARVRLVLDASYLDATGMRYEASRTLDEEAPKLDPGWEVDQKATFELPRFAALTRLHLAVRLNDSPRSAEWNL